MPHHPGSHSEFEQRFQLVTDPVYLSAELAVIGADYGASSYTTKEQADGLVEVLKLTSDSLLLDIGSGPGWPGAYLSAKTGCRAVLTDPTFEGMVVAAKRRSADDLDTREVVAKGGELPFRDEQFDAATSSDVFC